MEKGGSALPDLLVTSVTSKKEKKIAIVENLEIRGSNELNSFLSIFN